MFQTNKFLELLNTLSTEDQEIIRQEVKRSFRHAVDCAYFAGCFVLQAYAQRIGLQEASRLVNDHVPQVRQWAAESNTLDYYPPMLETLDTQIRDEYVQQWRNARHKQAEHVWYCQEEGFLKRIYQKRPARDRPGFVYFIRLGQPGNLVKIGQTIDVERRFRAISPRLPYARDIVFTISSQDCVLLETTLPEYFAVHRREGEWFELDSDDLDFVRWVHWEQF